MIELTSKVKHALSLCWCPWAVFHRDDYVLVELPLIVQ